MEPLSYLRLAELILSSARRAAEEGAPDALSGPVELWIGGETFTVERCFLADGKIVLASDPKAVSQALDEAG